MILVFIIYALRLTWDTVQRFGLHKICLLNKIKLIKSERKSWFPQTEHNHSQHWWSEMFLSAADQYIRVIYEDHVMLKIQLWSQE